MRTRADLAAVALLVFAVLRIASTYTIFSVTVDEPMHVSAGLEIYEQHSYTYQRVNPPLPRLVLALVPLIGGMELDPARDMNEQLLRVFHSNGRYKTNLVLARAGNLLFFLIAALATWWWARRELGPAGGFIAALLFTMQPVIVGLSGLATTDIAAVAGVAASLFAFSRWLHEPAAPRAAMFGAAFGFAVLCKYSAIGYVPAASVAMYLVRFIRDPETRRAWKRIAPSLVVASAACAAIVAIGFGFQLQPLIDGLATLRWFEEKQMFVSYFCGRISWKGFLWYFPVAVALKSTLASLILALCALLPRISRVSAEALAATAAILALSMTSHLTLGVRYVLPIYAPLAVAGAGAALFLLQHRARVLRVAATLLLAWHAGASLITHPDGLAYFNEAAGRRPWRYLIDSNIDWGQDVLRLKRVLREKRVERVGLAITGWHDWEALGFPRHYSVRREVPSQGWIAVSEQPYGISGGVPWLERRRYERIGKSIRLYHID